MLFPEKNLKILESVACFVPKIKAWWQGKNKLISCIQGLVTLQVEATKLQRQLWMLCLLFLQILRQKGIYLDSDSTKTACKTKQWSTTSKQNIEQQQITNHTPKQHSTFTSFNRSTLSESPYVLMVKFLIQGADEVGDTWFQTLGFRWIDDLL